MRLFVAVTPPEPVAGLIAALPRPERPGVRWTTRSQWHVTLRFLGDAPPDVVANALAEMGAVGPLTATLGPVTAWFPGRRVLQVAVAGLDRLAAATRQVTAEWGQPDEQPYSGHLTLARSPRRRGPADLAGTPISARFTVEDFALYSSRTEAGGAVYEQLAVYPLTREPGRA